MSAINANNNTIPRANNTPSYCVTIYEPTINAKNRIRGRFLFLSDISFPFLVWLYENMIFKFRQ